MCGGCVCVYVFLLLCHRELSTKLTSLPVPIQREKMCTQTHTHSLIFKIIKMIKTLDDLYIFMKDISDHTYIYCNLNIYI